MSPDMPSSGKRLQLTRACSSHLCRTRVSVVFLFQHRRADHHGEPALHVDGPSLWVQVLERKRHPDVTHHQEGKQTTNNGALCEPTGQTQSR